MRRLAAVAALVILSGCAKKLTFEPFSDGGFSAEVPAGWAKTSDQDFSRRPVAVMTWVGAMTEQDEGQPIGAVINVSRVARKREGVKDDKSWDRFKADWLDRSDKLFENAKSDVVTYRQEFTLDNKLHGLKPTPMALEDVVVRTPDAYWVLDYRATKALFDEHYPAFERLKKTYKVGS